jgi:hypothetical protein
VELSYSFIPVALETALLGGLGPLDKEQQQQQQLQQQHLQQIVEKVMTSDDVKTFAVLMYLAKARLYIAKNNPAADSKMDKIDDLTMHYIKHPKCI